MILSRVSKERRSLFVNNLKGKITVIKNKHMILPHYKYTTLTKEISKL